MPTADVKVQAGGTARYPIATSEEDPQAHATGTEDSRPAELSATVKRTIDPQQLARFVSGVTGLSGTVTSGIAGAAGDSVSFVDVTGSGSATIGFHKSPASFRQVISGGGGTIIVDGHNCVGIYGTWTVKIDIIPGGEQIVNFTATKDNPTGSFRWGIPIPSGVHSGQMSATVSDTQVTFSGGTGVATPMGSAGRSDAGSAPITRGPTADCK